MLIAEAIRNAQKLTGKKVVTGEDVRRGLESLNITEARLKEIGMEGFAAPVKVTCDDHNGHHKVYVAEWDGTKWTKGSDWIEPMKRQGAAAARGRRQGLRREATPAGRSAREACEQVLVTDRQALRAIHALLPARPLAAEPGDRRCDRPTLAAAPHANRDADGRHPRRSTTSR